VVVLFGAMTPDRTTEDPLTSPAGISVEELQLAARNHGMPLEALQWTLTPVGLHYLLIHYDVPFIDPSEWRLTVDGRVREELSLSLEDLRSRPAVRFPATFECAGNGRALLEPRPLSQPWLSEAVGTAEWTGAALGPLLEDAGLLDDAVEVVFTGMDRGVEGGVEQDYARSLSVEDAISDDVLLAYAINGVPLPPQHGFPLRLLVPGWYGMANVKWLSRITVVAEPFQGYQQARGYRMRIDPDQPGTPVTRMMPRALMVPPGIPDFMSRRRFVNVGDVTLRGRAWSGWGPIRRVEVSTDGGAAWADAQLEDGPSPWAWSSWTFGWKASEVGDFELRCRATDAAGNVQPDEVPWNVGGYENDSVQRVPVTVRPNEP
jgi:DMSO/TMAO reductase YedYZ molybdopterin-dependent catalytic subunit